RPAPSMTRVPGSGARPGPMRSIRLPRTSTSAGPYTRPEVPLKMSTSRNSTVPAPLPAGRSAGAPCAAAGTSSAGALAVMPSRNRATVAIRLRELDCMFRSCPPVVGGHPRTLPRPRHLPRTVRRPCLPWPPARVPCWRQVRFHARRPWRSVAEEGRRPSVCATDFHHAAHACAARGLLHAGAYGSSNGLSGRWDSSTGEHGTDFDFQRHLGFDPDQRTWFWSAGFAAGAARQFRFDAFGHRHSADSIRTLDQDLLIDGELFPA